MKNLYIGLCLLICFLANAQNDSLETKILWEAKNKVSLFATGYSQISILQEQMALYLGGGAAISINKKFFIGAYFLNLQSGHNAIANYDGTNKVYRFESHHRGLWLGYIINPHKLIHPTVDLGFGSGYIRYFGNNISSSYRSNPFFMISPGIGIEANLTEFLKLQLKGGYQFSSNFAGGSVGQDDIRSTFLNLGLRLGKF